MDGDSFAAIGVGSGAFAATVVGGLKWMISQFQAHQREVLREVLDDAKADRVAFREGLERVCRAHEDMIRALAWPVKAAPPPNAPTQKNGYGQSGEEQFR